VPDSLAINGSPGLYEQVWFAHMKPMVPKELVWSGISSVNGGELSQRRLADRQFKQLK
jgi:endoglucanase